MNALSLALLLLAPTVVQAQDAPDIGKLAELIRWGGVAASIPLLIATTFVLRIVEDAGNRLSARFSSRRLTIQKVQASARFLLYIAAITVAGSLSIRLDATALTVLGGALAVSVGFALRDLVASFIAGITIMFDRPFQVGDRVSYGGQYGDVVQIGLRSVRLNTPEQNVVTIPNNRIFTDVTSSSTYGALEMQVTMDFHIGLEQDATHAIALIREACLTSPYVYLGQPVQVFAKQVTLHDVVALQLRARPYVFDSKYEDNFESDVHLRVLEAFRAHGIMPPAALVRARA